MATKLKNWTARRSVKICCTIMIPILLFISLLGVVGCAKLEHINGGVVFADLNNNDFFFDSYIPRAESWAQTLFHMQSEEHIRNMGCLEWAVSEYTEYNENGDAVSRETYELVSTIDAGPWYIGSIPSNDTSTPQARQIVEEAISQQLEEFYYIKSRLAETPGLSYFITDGTRSLSNVSRNRSAAFFRSQAVYSIAEPGKAYEYSRSGDMSSRYSYFYSGSTGPNNLSSYIAFSGDAVEQQNTVWKTAQRQLKTQLIVIAVPTIAAAIFMILLLAGAGRKYGDESGGVYFTVMDKPWLDLGLALLVIYESVLCYIIYEAAWTAWRYDNTRWILALCAGLAVFGTLPMLGWLTSFAKYCKAGKWWRHTFTYAFIRGTFDQLQRLANSLWSGFPLTLKAALLGCLLFVPSLIGAVIGSWEFALLLAFLVAALATFCLLRYTRKLFLVEQGARAASDGRYDTPIQVTGGELGSIATSINNISDGIHVAVAERLKSERFKTELITNVSHDIRTPLTSLITYTDLLKNEGLDSERAPEYLEILIQKSARLKLLTDDLFEASKALSGNIEAHLDPLDLADFVRQVLGEMDERLRESGLDFRLSLPDHAVVLADGKLLWRVMENLLSNVFKYALAGSRVYIDIAPEAGWYRLDIKNISDSPLNVDPSELIERFKRGDDARSGDGSGLGLSIAQSFVLAQGGRFHLSIDGDLFKASLYLPRP